MMNAFTALIAGLLAGWLIEWILDWILWRRRQAELKSQLDRAYIKLGSADAASHALEHQLETLKIEHAALQSKYNSLAARIADTQPRTAVKKLDEEETWTETAPVEEWVPETAVSETPSEPLPSAPETTEAPEASAEELAASPAPEAEPPTEAIQPEPTGTVTQAQPAQPTEPAPAVQAEPVEAAPAASATPIPAEASIPGLQDEPAPSDNLRAIKGIGPAIEYKLRQAGINTYKDLAESTPERVADAIGMTFLRLVNVDALIAQARQLAANQNGGGQA
jgi:predicted flap endonuclease-1-like 5' DNA nuclease